ncbi:MAG: hypothetical protein ACI80I_003342, partial [Akkermansiaceae bacterium]
QALPKLTELGFVLSGIVGMKIDLRQSANESSWQMV